MSLYLDRESDEADEILMSAEYMNHISAMTREKLHSKAAIAIELAMRDLQLQQYKSIVKTVDADNLPDVEVWAWCNDGLFLGTIFKSAMDGQLKIDCFFGNFRNPTHYIETKDIIKMMGDL